MNKLQETELDLELFNLDIGKRIRNRIKFGLINSNDRENIKKSGYGEELEKLLNEKGFFGKKVKISHKGLGEIHSKKIGLNENNETIYEYTNDGFIIGTIIGVEFYQNALWCIQLKPLKGGLVQLVDTEILDQGVKIELIEDKSVNNQQNKISEEIKEIINT